ncbi:hypothetical protein [Paenibacillus durus]|uniref:hypothetical protein n=1 Tax=Paenibacillus durus TaxID=44251 RepID=UPI0005A5D475|nr:hypothetical protein [Paenibacillus durus]
MTQQTMYPASPNSQVTELSAAITDTDTAITVVNGVVLPGAPNIVTLGTDETAETVLYTGKSGNNLTGVTRGFGGTTAKSWAVGTKVARYFTAADHEAFRGNINDIIAQKGATNGIATLGTDTKVPIAQLPAATASTVNTLIQRDANGRAQVAAPSAAADIARKDTVDGAITTHKAESDPHTQYYKEGDSVLPMGYGAQIRAKTSGGSDCVLVDQYNGNSIRIGDSNNQGISNWAGREVPYEGISALVFGFGGQLKARTADGTGKTVIINHYNGNTVQLGDSNNQGICNWETNELWHAGSLLYKKGNGSPEGSVTAPVGTLYARTDGGASTTLYVKQSGSGNTGWVAK